MKHVLQVQGRAGYAAAARFYSRRHHHPTPSSSWPSTRESPWTSAALRCRMSLTRLITARWKRRSAPARRLSNFSGGSPCVEGSRDFHFRRPDRQADGGFRDTLTGIQWRSKIRSAGSSAISKTSDRRTLSDSKIKRINAPPYKLRGCHCHGEMKTIAEGSTNVQAGRSIRAAGRIRPWRPACGNGVLSRASARWSRLTPIAWKR